MNAVNLFYGISAAHLECQGWCSWNKAETLAAMVMAMRHKLSVEIGVFGGKSLLPLAMAHKRVGVGRVIGIDPWMASASVEGQADADAVWWSDQRMHDGVLADFKQKVAKFDVDDVVEIRRCRSDDTDISEPIGLLHIDGNHGEQAIRDVRHFTPQVARGGIVVVDDITWSGGAVSAAVEELIRLGFEERYRVTEQNVWGVFQRL